MDLPGTTENLSIESSAPVQSVDRALRLVEILAVRQVAGVTELASLLGVHKSTASRLLSTLELHGMVEQDSGHGSYRLGSALTSLAGSVSGRVRLLQASHPTAERLAHEVGETVSVAVLEGDGVVNVDQIAPGHLASRDAAPGHAAPADAAPGDTRSPGIAPGDIAPGPGGLGPGWAARPQPIHASASGKVLLAWLPDGDGRRVLLGRPLLERYTTATVVDPDELALELVRVREQGWSLALEEQGSGLNAVSAPIFDRDGAAIAALTVSGPAGRLGAERLGHVGVLTAQRATEVSSGLGYLGRADP